MTNEQLYIIILWVIKALSGLGLLLVLAYLFIRAKTPEFPEDDGERM